MTDKPDIVELLRTWNKTHNLTAITPDMMMDAAADEIERLRAENKTDVDNQRKKVVTWLFARAEEMNDGHARQIIHLIADEIGRNYVPRGLKARHMPFLARLP